MRFHFFHRWQYIGYTTRRCRKCGKRQSFTGSDLGGDHWV